MQYNDVIYIPGTCIRLLSHFLWLMVWKSNSFLKMSKNKRCHDKFDIRKHSWLKTNRVIESHERGNKSSPLLFWQSLLLTCIVVPIVLRHCGVIYMCSDTSPNRFLYCIFTCLSAIASVKRVRCLPIYVIRIDDC